VSLTVILTIRSPAGPAARTGIALTADTHLITLIYTGWNFHRDGTLMTFTTGAAAFGTRLTNDAAFPAAFRADGDISKTSEKRWILPV